MKHQLAKGGDGLERRWAQEIAPHMPRYQEFWSRHIVPLTFRDAEDPALRSNFVRPTNLTLYINYADANYAVFFHLSRCFYWLRELGRSAGSEQYDSEGAILGTEAIYGLYAHAISAYDSTIVFCEAVNSVLAHHKRSAAFRLNCQTQQQPKFPTRIRGFVGGTGTTSRLNSFVDDIKTLRNLVIHRGIVHLQNGYLPDVEQIKKAQQESLLHHFVGLAAIGVFARDRDKWLNQGIFDQYFRPAVEQGEEHIIALCENLDPIWDHAAAVFDDLLRTCPAFKKRAQIKARDRSLTPEVFNRARSLGRPKPRKGTSMPAFDSKPRNSSQDRN
jgi:hypothetical protein